MNRFSILPNIFASARYGHAAYAHAAYGHEAYAHEAYVSAASAYLYTTLGHVLALLAMPTHNLAVPAYACEASRHEPCSP